MLCCLLCFVNVRVLQNARICVKSSAKQVSALMVFIAKPTYLPSIFNKGFKAPLFEIHGVVARRLLNCQLFCMMVWSLLSVTS